jgi:hypothetical protein
VTNPLNPGPNEWTHELYRLVDVDGVECVVYRDQDGDVFIVDAAHYPR